MFCKNCGQEIADNLSFCTKCGSPVNQSVNQSNPNPVYPNNTYGGQPHGGQPHGGQPHGWYQTNGYPPQRTINSPGQVLLIIVGVLLLIGGILRLSTLLDSAEYLQYTRILGDEFLILYTIKICCAAILIFGGIRGLVYCSRPDKGNAVASNGISIVAFQVIDWIAVSMMTDGLIDPISWDSIVFGIILAILLAIGGSMNHKAFQNAGGGRY